MPTEYELLPRPQLFPEDVLRAGCWGSSAPRAVFEEAWCTLSPATGQTPPKTTARQEARASVRSGYLWATPGPPSSPQQGSAQIPCKGPGVNSPSCGGLDSLGSIT